MFVSPYTVLMTLLLLLETKRWNYNNQFTAEIQQLMIDWLDSVLRRIGNHILAAIQKNSRVYSEQW